MRIGRGALFVLLIGLGIAAQWSRAPDVFVGGQIYFLDPDCYSRMTRVARIEQGEGPSLRFHDFENAPQGTRPHTTASLDFLILGLAGLLRIFGCEEARDWAGALVSPALGLIFLLGVALWAWRQRCGSASLLVAAVSPILAHSFSVGRPDHQSLLLVLLMPAMLLEWEYWRNGFFAPVASGVLWAIGLWVSLFELLILLILALLLRGLATGRGVLPADRRGWAGLLAFTALFVLAVAWDGLRIGGLPAHAGGGFARWAATIGELQPAGFAGLFAWSGWLGPFVGVGLLFSRSRAGFAMGLMLFGTACLAYSMARWGPFFVLLVVIALPAALSLLPVPWMSRALLLCSMWPVAQAWDRQLFPSSEEAVLKNQRRMEGPLLRQIAASLPRGSVFLAPWWLSPALAYWADARGVSGSSHQSLVGNLRSAEFFLEEDPAAAHALASQLGAEFVVGDEARRMVENSSAILGRSAPELPMAERLWKGECLPYFHRLAGNPFYRLYRSGTLPEGRKEE